MTCLRRARLILSCFPVALTAAPVWAQQTINVPADAPTIQAGINAAADGDTVLVAPGTYTENINFMGKAITVTSSGGPTATTIDGGQQGTVVSFITNEPRSAVLNGFTITDDGPPLPTAVNGTVAGIFVDGASPTITNNIITNNRGYGIEVSFASAYISANTITNTSTAGNPSGDYGCDYDDGDGVYIAGTNTAFDPPVIDHNTIEQNVGHCLGGGIGLYAASPSTVISNNIIANNQSLGYGGGVYEVNGSVSLYQNLIYNNVSGVAGGGVYLSTPSETNGATGPLVAFITNNTIYGNTISLNQDIQDAWVDGSQVALAGYVSQLGFFNNLIVANDSYSAISCWPLYQYLSGAPPVVVNSDVINTGGPAYGGWCTVPAGNTANISADPKFNNPSGGDFHLQSGSPAIDTGFNPAPGSFTTDLDGNPRIQNATGASEPVVDMGAYEATGTPESRSSSQLTLTGQPATIFYGQAVSLSTTVTNTSSSPIPPGTVNFLDDWAVIQESALNSSGVATVSTSSLAIGSHWLVASFSGNGTYQPGISTAAEVVVNGFSTSTAISFSPNPGRIGQTETLTATVTLDSANPPGPGVPSGSVAFYVAPPDGPVATVATVSLNANGVAAYATTSLQSGTNYIQAIYQPTGGFLGSSSENTPLVIAAPPIATVTVLPNPGNITISQPANINITVSGTVGNPTPTGTVTLTSGSYSSASTTLNNGTTTITVPAGSLPAGSDTLAVQYSGDSVYSAANGTGSIVVVGPFAISGTPLSVSPGAASGNQSTITVTPSGGFVGTVALTAALTSSPAGATTPPTFSFNTANVTISTAAAAIATLAVTTVAPVGCPQSAGLDSTARWSFPFEIALGFFLFFTGLHARPQIRRLSILLLLIGLSSWLTACGGGGSSGGSCSLLSPGTTPGNYIITVSGTSGSVTANANVSLTVQ
jgi:parallel beta-helix repeat protein